MKTLPTVPYDKVPMLQPSESGRLVNLLSSEKRLDWRYETYDALKKRRREDPATVICGELNTKEIFWIGILPLNDIREHPDGPYQIGFYNGGSRCTQDAYRKRHEDGRIFEVADGGHGEYYERYLYNLPKDLLAFLKREAKGGRLDDDCFQMVLREVVRDDGMHWVWLIKCESAKADTRWGLRTPIPWYCMHAGDMRWATEFMITQLHQEELLLVEKPYRWLK